jgi:hypothetical protein
VERKGWVRGREWLGKGEYGDNKEGRRVDEDKGR